MPAIQEMLPMQEPRFGGEIKKVEINWCDSLPFFESEKQQLVRVLSVIVKTDPGRYEFRYCERK